MEQAQENGAARGSAVERLVMWFARHGKSECPNCGTWNNVGTPCPCFASRGKKIGEEVRACFDNVDWAKNTFIWGNHKAETDDGQTVFYKAKDIDQAIKKLNIVLNDLDT